MTFLSTVSNTRQNGACIYVSHKLIRFKKEDIYFEGAAMLPKTIALCIDDVSSLVKVLLLADGCVENIIILSSAMPEEKIVALIENKEDYVFISDININLPHIKCDEFINRYKSDNRKDVITSRWILATSGTTGNPKLVSHTFQSLTRTIKNKASISNIVWGLVYDPSRYAGMQVILQALCTGTTLVAPPLNAPLNDKIMLLKKLGVTALSATPTLWKKIALSGLSEDWDLKTVTLGGEIADQRILDVVNNKFSSAYIQHIYASTEAGTGFSVTDKMAGFPADFLNTRPNGVEVRVENNRLLIKNTMIKESYVGTNQQIVDKHGFVNTGDIVEKINDRFYFRGRENGVINVGGDKVYPESIEHVLGVVPGVKGIRIYGVKNSIVGQLVNAEVSLTEGAEYANIVTELEGIATNKLTAFQRPVKYHLVNQIQHTESGKVSRR